MIRIVAVEEVEFVLWNNRYMSVEDFLAEIEEAENCPDSVFVADRYPLRISSKSKVEDFTHKWDEEFSEWMYPPEWKGSDEFQAAIDLFLKAAHQFEATNKEWFSLCCNHSKKVLVSELKK